MESVSVTTPAKAAGGASATSSSSLTATNCSFCHRVFPSVYYKNEHEEDDHKHRRILCNVCGDLFKGLISYIQHRKNAHQGQGTFGITYEMMVNQDATSLQPNPGSTTGLKPGSTVKNPTDADTTGQTDRPTSNQTRNDSLVAIGNPNHFSHSIVTRNRFCLDATQREFNHICDMCGQFERSNEKLAIHCLVVHSGKDKNVCHLCGRKHRTQEYLIHHLEHHHRLRFAFQKRAVCRALEAKRDATRGELRCFKCGASFRRFPRLVDHHLASHRMNKKYVKCPFCPHHSGVRQSIHSHLKYRHSTRYRYIWFHVACALKIKYQLNLPDVACLACEALIFDVNVLVDHYVSHHLLPYDLRRCPECRRRFGLGQNKFTHYQKCHRSAYEKLRARVQKVLRETLMASVVPVPEEEIDPLRPFACPLCSRSFVDDYRMGFHFISTHLMDSHVCTTCRRSFGSKMTCANHVALEHKDEWAALTLMYRGKIVKKTNQPSYLCPSCRHGYKTLRKVVCHYLHIHKFHMHYPGEVGRCYLCKTRIKKRKYTIRHLRSRHPAELEALTAEIQTGVSKIKAKDLADQIQSAPPGPESGGHLRQTTAPRTKGATAGNQTRSATNGSTIGTNRIPADNQTKSTSNGSTLKANGITADNRTISTINGSTPANNGLTADGWTWLTTNGPTTLGTDSSTTGNWTTLTADISTLLGTNGWTADVGTTLKTDGSTTHGTDGTTVGHSGAPWGKDLGEMCVKTEPMDDITMIKQETEDSGEKKEMTSLPPSSTYEKLNMSAVVVLERGLVERYFKALENVTQMR